MAVDSSSISLKPTKDDNSNNNGAVKLSSERHDVQKVRTACTEIAVTTPTYSRMTNSLHFFFFPHLTAHMMLGRLLFLYLFLLLTLRSPLPVWTLLCCHNCRLSSSPSLLAVSAYITHNKKLLLLLLLLLSFFFLVSSLVCINATLHLCTSFTNAENDNTTS